MMKLSNFRHLAKQDGYELAAVDETTGWGPWKKVVLRKVFRAPGEFSWRFLDTGRWTPAFDVERMADAAKAKEVFESHASLSTIANAA